MSDIAILSTVIGIVGTACAIAFGYSAWKRNHKVDDTTAGEKSATVLTEIGYIKSGIDDIKRKQDKQDTQYLDTVTRLTAVEASAKQAHKRIDRLEGRADREE
ncbi:MAG: hypothetical protein LBD02_01820 [Christensenellaceae bacterium]|jgi:hypothetical protein|nr:hypothetical protein [Christensenellaceae bacterium]